MKKKQKKDKKDRKNLSKTAWEGKKKALVFGRCRENKETEWERKMEVGRGDFDCDGKRGTGRH